MDCSHECNCCQMFKRCKWIDPRKWVDYDGAMLMRDFWLQEYEKWKKEQKKEEKVPETKQEEWRFQWGDVVPKQGYNSFSEYIRDAACLVGDNETKPLSEILEEDGQFRYYFGIKQLI